jgi:hypothetical protein
MSHEPPKYRCRHCHGSLLWRASLAGHYVKCLHCGKVTPVPAHSPSGGEERTDAHSGPDSTDVEFARQLGEACAFAISVGRETYGSSMPLERIVALAFESACIAVAKRYGLPEPTVQTLLRKIEQDEACFRAFEQGLGLPPDARRGIPLKRTRKKGCFIATACYGAPDCAEVAVLRRFRDAVLLDSDAGTVLVRLYYRVSPSVAAFLRRRPLLGRIVRSVVLQPIVKMLGRAGR